MPLRRWPQHLSSVLPYSCNQLFVEIKQTNKHAGEYASATTNYQISTELDAHKYKYNYSFYLDMLKCDRNASLSEPGVRLTESKLPNLP